MTDDEPDLDDFEASLADLLRRREAVRERLRMVAQLLDAGVVGTTQEMMRPGGDVTMKIGRLDQQERALQKQAVRDEDARRLDAGEVTPEELDRENGLAAGLDMPSFRIVAVGRRTFGKGEP